MATDKHIQFKEMTEPKHIDVVMGNFEPHITHPWGKPIHHFDEMRIETIERKPILGGIIDCPIAVALINTTANGEYRVTMPIHNCGKFVKTLDEAKQLAITAMYYSANGYNIHHDYDHWK